MTTLRRLWARVRVAICAHRAWILQRHPETGVLCRYCQTCRAYRPVVNATEAPRVS